MESNENIRKNINDIKQNENKLFYYLYDLVYREKSGDINFLETLYADFLEDSRVEIRRIAIYCLLFGLKIRNERYKEIAVKNVQDINNGLDIRLFSMSGLSEAYCSTQDTQLLSLFYDIFNNPNEDDIIRAQSFTGMMRILGLSSLELIKKNNNKLIILFDDIKDDNFDLEITFIKNLIK